MTYLLYESDRYKNTKNQNNIKCKKSGNPAFPSNKHIYDLSNDIL